MNPWTTPVLVAVQSDDPAYGNFYFHAIVYAHPGDRLGFPDTSKYIPIGKLSRNELKDLVDQRDLELTHERVFASSNLEYRPEQSAATLEYLYHLSHTSLMKDLSWK